MKKLISDLVNFIRTNYSPQEKVKETKDGGQTMFFRKGGKSLCYIETKDEKSTVTVIIGASLNDKVEAANISQNAKKMFKNAKQFFDGKWLFFNVETKKDLEDIKTLLMIKKKPIKK